MIFLSVEQGKGLIKTTHAQTQHMHLFRTAELEKKNNTNIQSVQFSALRLNRQPCEVSPPDVSYIGVVHDDIKLPASQ